MREPTHMPDIDYIHSLEDRLDELQKQLQIALNALKEIEDLDTGRPPTKTGDREIDSYWEGHLACVEFCVAIAKAAREKVEKL